jgi:endogenous inhibitor of DNA gyrase (YacG/DUF329 family)
MTALKTHKCPRCKKETSWNDNPDRPFCSEKCRLIDLGRWAEEEYRIPTREAPMSEDNVIPFNSDTTKE